MPKDGEPAVEESAVEEHIADLAAKDDVPEARAAGVDQSETPIAGDEALAVEEPMDAAPNAEPDAEVKADEAVVDIEDAAEAHGNVDGNVNETQVDGKLEVSERNDSNATKER